VTRAERRRLRSRPAWSQRQAWERDATEPEPVDREAQVREGLGKGSSGCSRTRPLYETEEGER
jgi:hypothetical protein